MKIFNQNEFNEFVLTHNVIGFYETAVTLNSGRNSYWYANWRGVSNDPFLMEQLTNFVIMFCEDKKLNPDFFVGVSEGATKLGILTQYEWAKRSENYSLGSHCLPMERTHPKKHGLREDRYFVGRPRGKGIVLEDVTTTGHSIIKTISNLLECTNYTSLKIIGAIGLTDRMEVADERQGAQRVSIETALESMDVPYYSMSKAVELLPLAYEKMQPGKLIGRAIEEEYEQFGVEKIKLLD